MELAVAGIGDVALVIETEEARAVDGDIQRIAGSGNAPLAELLRHGSHADTHSRLGGAASRERIGKHVGELRMRLLESNRIGVRHVIADHVQIPGRCIQTTQALLKTHDTLLVLGKRLAPAWARDRI